uniref:Ig-like domain-containing protein n=1 Tax=Ciona intestinalis TaxID=7719 RepID=H2XWM3_CIOIN
TKQTAMVCILFFVFLTLAAEGNMLVRACPQQGGACDCNSVTRSVTCTRLGSLTRRLPLGIPANTKVLTVNHSTLSRLGPTAFRNCYQLEVVDLSDNRLEDISQLAFQSLGRLRSLNLSDNRLRVVTEDTFLHLKRLEFLDLSRNRLIVLTPDNFKNLHNLKELKLSNNPTMCIAPSAFWGMKKLQVLELSKLGSHGIPKTLLTGLSRLQTLSLKACSLDNIPNQLLDRVQRSIVELDLSHNLINIMVYLNIMNIPITSRLFSLQNLYYLKTLNLRRTGLTLIESGALNLSNLVNIDLYGNNLSVMTVSAELERVQCTISFKQIYNFLLLNGCNESVFGDSMKTLRNVSLANNPWVCDCRLRWIIRSNFVTTTDRPVVCVQPPWMQGYNIRSPVDHSTLRVDSFSCKYRKSRETSLSLGSSMAPVTIKVVCKSDGFPKPKVRWVLPYTTALNDGVTQVSKDGSLHLHMVTPQQATGVYTCRSSNQFGGSEMSFVIT